jgi:hypothetical protein
VGLEESRHAKLPALRLELKAVPVLHGLEVDEKEGGVLLGSLSP